MHRAIPHWFYWCWNANSGDTGQSALSTHLLVPFSHTHYVIFTWFVTSPQLISNQHSGVQQHHTVSYNASRT